MAPIGFVADPRARAVGSGRQRPGAIYVDGTGKRFCNESNSYVEVGKAMYANKAVPCWQIFDEGYLRRYVSGANPFAERSLPEGVIESGGVVRGETIADLARQIDVPLKHWSKRFGASTSSRPKASIRTSARPVGVQHLPGRSRVQTQRRAWGRSIDGPVLRRPRCSLPTSARAGVITNEHAQVIGKNDQVIDGPVRDGQHHRDRDGPNLSRAPAAASPTRWCSAMSPRATQRVADSAVCPRPR